jgi:hypothetical protein
MENQTQLVSRTNRSKPLSDLHRSPSSQAFASPQPTGIRLAVQDSVPVLLRSRTRCLRFRSVAIPGNSSLRLAVASQRPILADGNPGRKTSECHGELRPVKIWMAMRSLGRIFHAFRDVESTPRIGPNDNLAHILISGLLDRERNGVSNATEMRVRTGAATESRKSEGEGSESKSVLFEGALGIAERATLTPRV